MSDLRPRSRGSRTRGVARHGRLKRSNPWRTLLGFLGAALVVVLVSTATVGAIAVWQINRNIQDNTVEIAGETVGPPPNIGAMPGGFNILIVGSDTREGQDGIGGNESGTLNDVNILLHVNEKHTGAVAVSIPRDMVVPMPACENGGPATGLPINTTLSYGGLSCTVNTVEEFTGLDIQFSGLIKFKGVIAMSNAVGGVDVCVDGPINDPRADLFIEEAGMVNLKGKQALAFLRSRHGVGDGSDLGRISSQQVYLSALVRKLKSAETLTNVTTLYSLASAASKNLNLSPALAHLDTMVAIAQSLKDIPLERVLFVQYPGTTGVGGIYTGKVAPLELKGEELMELIREDAPFELGDAPNVGSIDDPNAPTATPTPTPTGSGVPTTTPSPTPSEEPEDIAVVDGISGQSAADYTCSKSN